jgi:hypothetical protein
MGGAVLVEQSEPREGPGGPDAAGGVPFTTGKTWSTDGIYRETRARAARRRKHGSREALFWLAADACLRL